MAAVVVVRAHPRAARDGAGPYRDGVLHLRTVRPAADGEANAALRRLLATALDVAPSRVRLLSGERGRTKRFEVDGVDAAGLAARLARIGPAD
jgi:uncharacterized protein YggU (UPF0235/DUF167 family)